MRVSIAVIGLILVVGFSFAGGQEKPASPPAQAGTERQFDFWMDVKLQASQNIFAALAEADFSSIVASAEGLKTLTSVEGFVRRKNPKYSTQLRTFEFAVAEIRSQAIKENIEGVVLGFHQLTLSCVNCHKQLRKNPIGTRAP